MPIEFDHVNRLILVPAAEAQPLDVEALRTACREEETSERGIVFPGIVNAAGLNILGPGQKTALTLELINNWQVLFTGSGSAVVSGGNLIGGIDNNPFAPAPSVAVINIMSAAAVLVEGEGGGGLTAQQVRNAMTLAATSVPFEDSIDDQLDRIKKDTTLIPATL